MSTPTNLAAISSFEQLLPYLEANLDWPTKQYSFEDLTFEFEPEELGLKDADAAKIKSIHQLRPLKASQPFGIFFVEFENKKLPVVVLRRILSHLALKKRASANKTDTPAWHAQDIIFVSAFGEDNTAQRELAFAHFHQTDGDLPTLRVLGWDGADTSLKLAQVDKDLRSCLHWPDDESDTAQWRAKWSAAFKHRQGHVIRKADELAQALALFARQIRDAAVTILEAESERGAFRKLYKGFKTALIHDLTEEAFADTYAQTITYGLFTAAVNRTDMSGGAESTFVKADDMTLMVRVTSPFLKDMLETFLTLGGRKHGVNFDELGIQDVVDLLRGEGTDLPAILRDFNNKTQGEDPVIHFYESFLDAYNKKLKIQRGVFYTPQPVVSYIVRSVHELLQTEFGLEDGLASTVTWGEMLKRNPDLKLPDLSDDPKYSKPLPESEYFVQILDPATGTATFLVETIDVIYNHLKAKWGKSGLAAMPALPVGTANCNSPLPTATSNCRLFTDFWNLYVPKCLLPRLHGYELLMAPYAIAHLKIGLKLSETGYRFVTEERARIYLTNALEPKVKQLPHIGFEALAHEAAAVNEIKWYKRFTVVIGNPPYSGVSANMGEYAQSLIEAYKHIDGKPLNERKHWLQDDYVKFLRISQMAIDLTQTGILGYITNHGFLDNPTFRGMRQSLLGSFTKIYGFDLRGSTKKAELAPEGIQDQNVFDIQQGVAITLALLTKRGNRSQVLHANLWGSREHKYSCLNKLNVHATEWLLLDPSSPYYFFVPQNLDNFDEYQSAFPINEAMPEYVNGIVTSRDGFVIDFEDAPIKQRLNVFLNSQLSDDEVKKVLDLSENYAWRVKDAREELRTCEDWPKTLTNILYRPFDLRRIAYHRSIVWRTRMEVMRHMISGNNLGLCTNRMVNGDFRHVGVSRHIINDCTLSLATKERTYLFPVWLYPDEDSNDLLDGREPRPNFCPRFLKIIATQLKLQQTERHGIPTGLTPEDIFNYAYAVFHSPTYRTRYAEFLKIDFPRLPLTSSLELFRALAALGGELVALQLMESQKLNTQITHWIGEQKQEIEKITYSDETVWIDKSKSAGFKGIHENVWNFKIGGYQVCEKWLKDRKGRTLTDDDITHYHKIIVALSETIRLMSEIDTVITIHGGWPGAFVERKEQE
jgi:hypothetical protein